jgi:hypothetical protein
LHDALQAERLGIPAVAIITDRFVSTVDAVGRWSGLPGYPYAVLEHPFAGNDEATLQAKAAIAVRAIVPLLTQRAG